MSATATRPASRILSIDVLRGVALFGVLVINIYDWLGEPAGPFDRAVVFVTRFFFENKFWPLFSFLFGLGFAIQFRRAAARGAPIFWVHIRRMVALYAFGLVLLVLLAGNPILVRYAVLGTLLLPFRQLSPRGILLAAGLVVIVASATRPLWVMNLRSVPPPPPVERAENAAPATSAKPTAEVAQPTFLQATSASLGRAVRLPARPVVYGAHMAELFTMFLVGLFVGKRRTHEHLGENRNLVARTLWWGLSLGFVGTTVAMSTADWSQLELGGMLLSNFARCVGGDLQSLGYAAAVLLLAERSGPTPATNLLATAGRMPLTNYLGQWLVMRILFDPFFLDLEGMPGPAAGFLIAVAIFIAQLAWSRLWMAHFQFGPAEWLWKSFAYLEPQTMRTHRMPGRAVSSVV